MGLVDRIRRFLGADGEARRPEISVTGGRTVSFGEQEPATGGESASPAAAAPAVARGSRLGRYLVLEAIGAGGTANVYAAYDPELDRKVALKVLRLDPGRGGCRRPGRLLREAQAAARLAHPNVITVYDVGMVDGRPFVAMELVDGETLDLWSRRGSRAWHEVLRVALAAGRGLAAAHGAGLAHRDFKPSNVIVARDGRVLVLDFGLALDATGEPPPGAAAGDGTGDSRAVAGTPGYLAPELCCGAAGDRRSDQFAYCVTVWEALYGRHPFRERAAPPEGSDAAPSAPPGSRVPTAVRRILTRGLATDRAARYPNMDDLLAALERALSRSRRRPALAAAAALMAVTATGAVVLGRPQPAETCTGSEERLAGAWDPALAAAGRRAFEAAGGERAVAIWERVVPRLDAYAAEWARVHREACEATHVRREQSPQMLDLQVACLHTRRRELAAVTGMLRQPEPEMVENAIPLVESLSRLDACADRPALMAQPAPPEDPADARRVAELRSSLAEGKAFEAAGRYREAKAVAETALAAAEEVGYPPVEADAWLRLAQAEGRVGRFAVMRGHLVHAAERAEAGGYDQAAGLAFALLMIPAIETGDLEAARTWAQLASGVVERTDDHGEVAAVLQLFLGWLAQAEGRYEDAVEHHRLYLDYSADVDTIPRPVGEAWGRLHLGRQYVRLERYDLAEAELERALALFTEALGEDHRSVAETLAELGGLRRRQGAAEAAGGLYRRALAVLDGDGQEDDWQTADVLDGLGASLLDLGREEEAATVLERSLATRASDPDRPTEVAHTRFLLARALWQLGATERSLRLAEESRQGLNDDTAESARRREELDRWLESRERGG